MLSGWIYPMNTSAEDVATELDMPVRGLDGAARGRHASHDGAALDLVPLSQYFSAVRHDYFTLASERSRQLAEAQGYVHVGDLGKVVAVPSEEVPAVSRSVGSVSVSELRDRIRSSGALAWAAALRIDFA